MKFSFAKFDILGRITQEPEIRQTAGGSSMAKLNVVWDQSYKQGEQWQKKPHFLRVTVFGYDADNIAKQLQKGDQVHISGDITLNTWEKDGQKRSEIQLVGKDFVPLARQRVASSDPLAGLADAFDAQEMPLDDADIPF